MLYNFINLIVRKFAISGDTVHILHPKSGERLHAIDEWAILVDSTIGRDNAERDSRRWHCVKGATFAQAVGNAGAHAAH